jgi:hypothetical protein
MRQVIFSIRLTAAAFAVVSAVAVFPLAPAAGAQTRIAAASPLPGRLETTDKEEDGRYYDEYLYSGRRGEQLLVDLVSTDFDAYLVLIDQRSGNVVSQSGDFGSSTNARISITLTENGTYLIRATSQSPQQKTGAYTLRVRSSLSISRSIEPSNPYRPDQIWIRPDLDKRPERRARP